uniref:Uncharacterized protein n=1 Tax=Anguilla anguilla TaxID=7936 RepID=A0A0E9XK45_ANGAN
MPPRRHATATWAETTKETQVQHLQIRSDSEGQPGRQTEKGGVQTKGGKNGIALIHVFSCTTQDLHCR